MPSGDLHYKIGFYQRGQPSPPPPDYGMGEGDFPATASFIVRGNIQPKLGGEAVLSARLTGKNFVNVTVRQSAQTSAVTTDWMAKDETTGEQFNIRSIIDPFQDTLKHGFWWEMLCEKGVAI